MSRRVVVTAAAPLLLALVALPGCASTSGDAYLDAMAAAERALHAGRYHEAARSFSDAAQRARRVKDRDEARLMEARSFQRAEAWREARSSYERLAAETPAGPRAARAEFELAELALEHGDVGVDADAGWKMLLEATRKHPSHGLARGALIKLIQHEEELGGPAAALAWLQLQAPALRTTELAQDVDYQTGLLLDRTGDREGAMRVLVATARAHPYPKGALTDDALVHAAKIAAELGRPREAIDLLRELLAPREIAVTGSYERVTFDDAQLRIAELYRDALGDHADAHREFRRLFERFRASRLRDDALWADAKLWRQDGDTEQACAAASRLARALPDSRYALCAHEICPALPPRERPCADYIVRELSGKPDD